MEINRISSFINDSIEITPFAFNFDVGFIQSPASFEVAGKRYLRTLDCSHDPYSATQR